MAEAAAEQAEKICGENCKSSIKSAADAVVDCWRADVA
jgi:hypothetical protein